ncbi:hypothetical protein [Mariniflexile sp. HMF6888]|uniref:hypothetical protein n=1 Tax=Mariniflexile sp. HMF6888 TaxID=3373086 RepID=UPI00379E87B3
MGRLVNKIVFGSTVLMCLLNTQVYSQVNQGDFNIFITNIPKEKIAININTDIILAGETLYYKLYSLSNDNNKPSHISKIAYVELIGENQNLLFSYKLKLVDGLANGDFFIPANTKTGNYKMIAYTKWMNNNENNPFCQTDIFIINPFLLNENTLDEQLIIKNKSANVLEIKKGENSAEQHLDNNTINLKTNSNTYKTRSKVVLELVNNLEQTNFGNYSLSVRKIDSLNIIKEDTGINDYFENSQINSNSIPEVRGEIISGKVISKSGDKLVSDKIVSLSISGSNFIYKNVKTDKSGNFYFNIYENYTDTDAIVQLLDENKGDYKIVIDDLSFKYYNKFEFQRINLNPNIQDWLLKQSIYNQIENAFHRSKEDSIISNKPSAVFYGQPTVEYVLDDYKRFPTVKETFVEVIQEAAIRKIGNTYRFKVYNYEELRNNVFSDYDPLVLVDGILIQNSDDVLAYDSNKIEKVNIVRGIYFYGPSIFNGIIDIKTKKGDFILQRDREYLNYFHLSSPKENKLYYQPKYNDGHESLKRIPDYRNQLLWEPNVYLNSNLKAFEFYTSDIEGMFEILLTGFTLNGKSVTLKKYIEVKNE